MKNRLGAKSRGRKRCCMPDILISVLMILCLGMRVNAENGDSQEHQDINVGYFSLNGYHMQDDDQMKSGYGYEFLQLVSRYENITYEYKGFDKGWEEMLEMLKDGRIDLLTFVRKTPERLEEFDFSDKDVGKSTTMLTVKSGEKDIISGEYDTYDGMVTGMLRGNNCNEGFEAFAAEHGFSYNPVYFDTEQELTQALQNREVDAAVTSNLRVAENEWVIDNFDELSFYAAVKKGNRELLAQVNDAIEKMDMDSPEWRISLQNKYYKLQAGENLMLTEEEQKYLSELSGEKKVFKVAVNPDRYPLSWFENGEAKGIIPSLFGEIARRAGITYEIVETEDRQAYMELLKDKKTDICMDLHDSYSKAEQMGYKITDPYLYSGFSWIQKKNFAGPRRKVAVLGLSVGSNTVAPNLEPGEEIFYFESAEDCLAAVQDGSVDGYCTYTYQAERFIFDDVKNDLTTVLTSYYTNFDIGVEETMDSSLLTILNKSIRSLDQSYVDGIIKKNTDYGEQPVTIVSMFYEYPAFFVILTIAVVFVAALGLLIILQGRYRKRLTYALQNAEVASRAKTDFLSNMSHDIRTPLNAIIGVATVAELGVNEGADIQKSLNQIRQSSVYLLSIVNDVLDMSAIEHGKMTLKEEPFCLLDQIDSVVSIIKPQADERGLTLKQEQSGVRHLQVVGDGFHLSRVLMNLLGNAVKFTQTGGAIELAVIEKELGEEGFACYEIIVSDNGVGMSKEFMERLCQPFEREHSSTVSGIQGTGLGLAISKNILDLMGGELRIQSEVGKGTSITVCIRFMLAEHETEAPEPESEEEPCCEGRRILLVDDNEINRNIASVILEHTGLQVDTAGDGAEALHIMEEAPFGTYDIIIMDIMMPNMNGYEATRRIRMLEDEAAGNIPIIAMTANAFDEDKEKALEAGMNEHMAKPIELGVLYALLKKYLKPGESDFKDAGRVIGGE